MDIDDFSDELEQRMIDAFQKEGFALGPSFKAIRSGRATALTHQIGIYRRLDEALRAVPDPLDASRACRSGCNYCCHYHVYVSAPEALAIAEHLGAEPAAQRDLYVSRLNSNAARVAELGMEQHVQTNVRCAFLAESGECSIYALRPAACRRHHSFDVTPCRTTFEDPSCTDQNPQSAEILATANGFWAAGVAAARLEGFDSARYEMSGAILEALTNGASSKRWKAGKTAFPSVADRDETGGMQQ